ncbi:MAG TPA: ABC transporter permease [bacterium]|nr:ABC transporter permease [bacterium]
MSGRYVLRRLGRCVFVLFGVTLLAFVVSRLKGDPVLLMVQPGATAADIEAMRRSLGLDGPLWLQFARFVGGALRGNLGMSIWQGQNVTSLLLERVPFTLRLSSLAILVVVAAGIPAGIVAARSRGGAWDQAIVAGAVAGQALPTFWVGLMLIYLFAVDWRLLPSFGAGDWRHLVMPVATLSLFSLARVTRLVRSSMLEVLGQDYIRTARAKGLATRRLLFRHALRNSLLPIVTLVGLEYGVALGGSVITETIFALPGVGGLAVQAIFNRDFPLIQAVVLFTAAVFVVVNFLVDMVYLAIDPRVQYT